MHLPKVSDFLLYYTNDYYTCKIEYESSSWMSVLAGVDRCIYATPERL